MSYRVIIPPPAAKFLGRLRDESLKRRLIKAMRGLETDPRPPGCVKLQGADQLYRIRVGDYRIIYEVQDSVLVVLVVQIGNRRDVYR